MKKTKVKFTRQYGYMSSAIRAIKNYQKKHGIASQRSINQLDDGCFEVEIRY